MYILDRELKHLIDIAISDGKLFFAIYVTVLVGGFYFAVRRTGEWGPRRWWYLPC